MFKQSIELCFSSFARQKPRSYNDGYRRNPNMKYKRNDRPPPNKHFQGTYLGPTKTFVKSNQKYNNSGNNSYDSTPMKDNGPKSHQHGHIIPKRDQSNADVDNPNGNNGFGSNVPPFPYFDPNEQHYAPPGNGEISNHNHFLNLTFLSL